MHNCGSSVTTRGTLAGFHREGEILDELLVRG